MSNSQLQAFAEDTGLAHPDQTDTLESGQVLRQLKNAHVRQQRTACQINIS